MPKGKGYKPTIDNTLKEPPTDSGTQTHSNIKCNNKSIAEECDSCEAFGSDNCPFDKE